MLAEKQRENPWHEQPGITVNMPKSKPRTQLSLRKMLLNAVGIVAVAGLGFYYLGVARSETLVTYSKSLSKAQEAEQLLISQNNELKIKVEQLKSPERIIGIAQNDLGMKIARNNIYVQAGK